MDLRRLSVPLRIAVMLTVIVILATAAWLWILTNRMPRSFLPGYPGDAFFPRIALAVVAIFGSFSLIGTFRKPRPDDAEDEWNGTLRLDLIETASVTLIGLAFMIILEPVGLEIATVLMMFALLLPRIMLPLPRAIAFAAVGAIVSMLVIYAGFVLGLKVSLPVRFFPAFL